MKNINIGSQITSLNKENAIVFTNQNGTLENQSTLTYDGTTVLISQAKSTWCSCYVDISENMYYRS